MESIEIPTVISTTSNDPSPSQLPSPNYQDLPIPTTTILSIEKLIPLKLRQIRPHIVKELTTSIKRDGYNPARPISVVARGDMADIADGCHRYEASLACGLTYLPCLVYPEGTDPLLIAVQCNEEESSYASQDLFDDLAYIKPLREAGETQEMIGKRIQKSRDYVARLSVIPEKIAPKALEIAAASQKGRVGPEVTDTFDYSEGWFRESGLYDIVNCEGKPNEALQVRVMNWFVIEKKCKAATWELYNKIQYMLPSHEPAPPLKPRRSTTSRLREQDRNKVIFGEDTLENLKKLPSKSIDLMVTDPIRESDIPEDMRFNPNRDGTELPALEILAQCLPEISRVLKESSLCYIFYPSEKYEEYLHLLEKELLVDPIPLVYINPRLKPSIVQRHYDHQYQTIFFCKRSGRKARKLNNLLSSDVLEFPGGKYRRGKPPELLKYIIGNSSRVHDVVLDPWCRQGSVLLAAAHMHREFLGFEENTKYRPGFIRQMGKLYKWPRGLL